MTVAMENNAASFIGGFLLSVMANVHWIFGQIYPHTPSDAATAAMEFGLKIIATLILGIIGGIAGLLGKDVYGSIKKKFNEKTDD